MNSTTIVSLLVGLIVIYFITLHAQKKNNSSSQSEERHVEPHRLKDLGRYKVSVFSSAGLFRTFEACEILQDRSGAVFAKANGEAHFTALIAPYTIEKITNAPEHDELKGTAWHYRASLKFLAPNQVCWEVVKAFPLAEAHGKPAYHLVLTNGKSLIVSGNVEFTPVDNSQNPSGANSK